MFSLFHIGLLAAAYATDRPKAHATARMPAACMTFVALLVVVVTMIYNMHVVDYVLFSLMFYVVMCVMVVIVMPVFVPANT